LHTRSRCSSTSKTSSCFSVKCSACCDPAALLVLWPLVTLGAAIVAMHARRNIPAIYQENRDHLARMNSVAILTGRTVLVEMERR